MPEREKLRKRLTKSSSDRVIAGVLGGLGKYFNIKPGTLRIIYLIVTALTSFVPGIIIYLMLAVLMPDDPKKTTPWKDFAGFFNHHHSEANHRSRKELHDVEERDVNK